jgi:hypothetical protein
MKYFELFNTPWGVDEDLKREILALDLPVLNITLNLIDLTSGNVNHCPLCGGKLALKLDDLTAIIKGDDSYIFDKSVKQKIKYHCDNSHSTAVLWPITEDKHNYNGNKLSVLFIAQKVLTSASKKQAVLSFPSIQMYFAVVFGVAIGMLADFRKNRDIGMTAEDREHFINQVEQLLNALMHACVTFDWLAVFNLQESPFKSMNLLKNFLRMGLYFYPKFPAFKNLDLEAAMITFCNYKVKSNVTAIIEEPTTTITASEDDDLEEEITDNHDDTCLELYSAPEEEFASDDGNFADDITDTLVQTTASFPSKDLNKVYQILFYNNMDLVSTGESTYGEITKAGIVKIIALIREKFFIYLPSAEQKKNFSMLDVGAGLMTSITHIAQELGGYYCGIENCPDRARLFATSYADLLETKVLVNTNIAYKWGGVEEETIFNFDCIYSFDETMKQEHWDHMMKVFHESPKCKFIITFRCCKDKIGNTNDYVLMVREYGLVLLHDQLVYMKLKAENCHAGFFVKKELWQQREDGLLTAANLTASVEQNWAECLQFWDTEDKIGPLKEIINNIDIFQHKAKKTRYVRTTRAEDGPIMKYKAW